MEKGEEEEEKLQQTFILRFITKCWLYELDKVHFVVKTPELDEGRGAIIRMMLDKKFGAGLKNVICFGEVNTAVLSSV